MNQKAPLYRVTRFYKFVVGYNFNSNHAFANKRKLEICLEITNHLENSQDFC